MVQWNISNKDPSDTKFTEPTEWMSSLYRLLSDFSGNFRTFEGVCMPDPTGETTTESVQYQQLR
jgi:hypothetical protein